MAKTLPSHLFAARHVEVQSPAWVLSVAVAMLMAFQAAVGLLVPSVYRDVGWVTAAWYGNDLVTLFVAVPLLGWSLVAVRGGSRMAELVWYAMLAYAVYNYAYYLFGATLNWFFPVYVTLFVVPAAALAVSLARIDAFDVAGAVHGKPRVRLIAAYMLLTGLGLATVWLAQWAGYLAAGVEPTIGVDAFALVAAMDLSFMVPWFVLGGVFLLRGNPWGSVIGPIMLVKGATYTLVLTATSLVASTRGVAGALEQVPIWAAWTILGGLAAWGYLRHVNGATRAAGPSSASR